MDAAKRDGRYDDGIVDVKGSSIELTGPPAVVRQVPRPRPPPPPQVPCRPAAGHSLCSLPLALVALRLLAAPVAAAAERAVPRLLLCTCRDVTRHLVLPAAVLEGVGLGVDMYRSGVAGAAAGPQQPGEDAAVPDTGGPGPAFRTRPGAAGRGGAGARRGARRPRRGGVPERAAQRLLQASLCSGMSCACPTTRQHAPIALQPR